ncbi:MAG: radical SAM protein, partial [Myxococcales bacterium]|nr:radical SAM protein [Myxococcales bacterium]
MRVARVVTNETCNQACRFCNARRPRERASIAAAAAVRRRIADAHRAGVHELVLTGGEPTIRPDLLPLLRAAKSLGYRDIKLQTNALLLAPPANAPRLVAAGVTRFHVSIHTHRPERYDALVRRPGAYPSMVRGLAAAVATGLPVVVEVILKEDTYRDLPDALRWLHARGVRQADLWFVSLTDANAAHPESMPRMTDVVPVMAEAFAFARA